MTHLLNKLPPEFYLDQDVVKIARGLLGKVLCSFDGEHLTSGIISETEAYNGIQDRACHAYNGRRTKRTETMYLPGGVAYIYLCYGIHHLFNIVTGEKDNPQAVLIRSIEPVDGIEYMVERRHKKSNDPKLTAGPGALTAALGITTADDGVALQSKRIWLAESSLTFSDAEIVTTSRIGVDYAEADALLPYRFYLKNSRYVSKVVSQPESCNHEK